MHVELKKKLFVTTVEAICALILSENLALYKLFTYLLTYYTSVWLWNMDVIRKGRIQTRWLLYSYAEDGHEHYVDGQNDERGPLW